MTADKYRTPFEASFEQTLDGIRSGVSDVKQIVSGMYKRLGAIEDATDAIYEMVSGNSRERDTDADDWDLLDENEEE